MFVGLNIDLTGSEVKRVKITVTEDCEDVIELIL